MRHHLVLLAAAFIVGCGKKPADSTNPSTTGGSNPSDGQTLVETRKGFQTRLVRPDPAKEAVEEPPAKLFRTVKYDSPAGKLAAYLTPDPKDGKKRPAIVWITGGDCNSIGDVWSPQPAKNDQTAVQYRQAGLILMFPSLRGGNANPGRREGFFGEVDDVLAAADFLAKQPYIDPNRIYLGGHSTGGTLSLLVSESSGRFRAVFSFGPTDDPVNYGPDNDFTPFRFLEPARTLAAGADSLAVLDHFPDLRVRGPERRQLGVAEQDVAIEQEPGRAVLPRGRRGPLQRARAVEPPDRVEADEGRRPEVQPDIHAG